MNFYETGITHQKTLPRLEIRLEEEKEVLDKMARPVLPTDFKDDVLAESMAGKRRYRIIQNVDGTVSLDDVTDYEQVGSTFGAKQVNDMSSAVNSIEDVKAANNCTTTEPGFVLDARQGKNLMG